MYRFAAVLLTSALGAAAMAAVQRAPAVPYPEGYRQWFHIKSMILKPGNSVGEQFVGIHHVYANEKALSGLRRGRYDDGAVLVFDLLEAEEDEEAIVEGGRKFVAVMHRDRKRYAATGGWGFEAFAGDSETRRVVDDGGRGCFSCHEEARATSFVFASWRR